MDWVAATLSIITLIFAIASFLMTKWRADKKEAVDAAKDTVKDTIAMLEKQNVAMDREIAGLKDKLRDLTDRMKSCEEARQQLVQTNYALMERALHLDREKEKQGG